VHRVLSDTGLDEEATGRTETSAPVGLLFWVEPFVANPPGREPVGSFWTAHHRHRGGGEDAETPARPTPFSHMVQTQRRRSSRALSRMFTISGKMDVEL
jgi:hypothetical protein